MSKQRITVVESPTKVLEVRHGRNFIRQGDLVKVRPSRPGKHDGFRARFKYADEDRGGLFYALIELENGKAVGHRFVKPDRVQRKATTHDPYKPDKEAAK